MHLVFFEVVVFYFDFQSMLMWIFPLILPLLFVSREICRDVERFAFFDFWQWCYALNDWNLLPDVISVRDTNCIVVWYVHSSPRYILFSLLLFFTRTQFILLSRLRLLLPAVSYKFLSRRNASFCNIKIKCCLFDMNESILFK